MVVQHNLQAMNSNRMLNVNTASQAKSTEKLSSGYKINRAADDAAGLAISEKMRRQVRGLTQASANAEDGISCVQTAEGALNEVHDMLQRINELSVKGENATLTTLDRQYIGSEVNQLMSEIDRVKNTTTFNEQNLLDGSFTGKGLQVGAESNQHIDISIDTIEVATIFAKDSNGATVNATTFYKSASLKNLTMTDFQQLNAGCKAAIKDIATKRSNLGAVQNRLEHTINNLDNVVENTTSAESSIRDTDMATERVKYANGNILAQAGQAMLAQANQANQGVLSLLQ